MSLHDDLILNWAFLDTVTQRSNMALWLAELEQWKTRAEAAEAALAAMTARAEAAEAKLFEESVAFVTHIEVIDNYAAYYAEATARGDAPNTFADWFGGAWEQNEVQP